MNRYVIGREKILTLGNTSVDNMKIKIVGTNRDRSALDRGVANHRKRSWSRSSLERSLFKRTECQTLSKDLYIHRD